MLKVDVRYDSEEDEIEFLLLVEPTPEKEMIIQVAGVFILSVILLRKNRKPIGFKCSNARKLIRNCYSATPAAGVTGKALLAATEADLAKLYPSEAKDPFKWKRMLTGLRTALGEQTLPIPDHILSRIL